MSSNEFGIYLKKEFSKGIKKYRVRKCLLCNQDMPTFCNSHSVPRFVLKNIAKDGKLRTSARLIDIDCFDLIPEEKGTNNTGTFHNICRSCDSSVFKEYENEESLSQNITNGMMLEIALKNSLYSIDKKYREKGIYDFTDDTLSLTHPASKVYDYDFKEDMAYFYKLKKGLVGKKNVKFDLFMRERLNYRVPIAFQTNFYLYGDIEGNIINELYSYDRHRVMQSLVFCVFPLKDSTIVLGFNDQSHMKNKRFIQQFVKKSLEERLKIINKINLTYSEDYYLSPCIDQNIYNNDDLKEVASDVNLITIDSKVARSIVVNTKLLNSLKDINDVPNLLSEKYKL